MDVRRAQRRSAASLRRHPGQRPCHKRHFARSSPRTASDAFQNLGEHYAGIRRWSPAFLSAFAFESVPASASLLRAIEVLRDINSKDTAALPKSVPTGFVRQRWAAYVMPGGVIDRRHYELCVLSELRDRLRAGDVWVTGSRQYRSVEERLICAAPFMHHYARSRARGLK